MSSLHKLTDTKRTQVRHNPGGACARCRLKKLKCDAERPQCSTCVTAKTECEPGASQTHRGPKKGYLRTLQNQVADLEQQLAQTKNRISSNPPTQQEPLTKSDSSFIDGSIFAHDASWTSNLMLAAGESSYADLGPSQAWLNLGPSHDLEHSITTEPLSTSNFSTAWPITEDSIHSNYALDSTLGFHSIFADEPSRPTELVQSDLNQTYFERIHPSIPILHRRKYFSWAHSAAKELAQICLQYAIWTLAASVSSSLHYLRPGLHRKTQQLLLTSEDSSGTIECRIEYIQARMLIAVHDFIHLSHRQGWVTAGHCFRMVQLKALHRLDDPLDPPKPVGVDNGCWIQHEEERRAFWMAYCLDVLVSKRGQWPLTLHEYVHATRLPLADDAFQSEKPDEMPFLQDILDSSQPQTAIHPFTELITYCTISRNIASLKRDRLDSRNHSILPTTELYNHHLRLSSMLGRHTKALESNHSPFIMRSDPILLFTCLFSHALALCLCSSLTKALPADFHGYDTIIVQWQQRALKASSEIVALSKFIPSLSYFRMHPFTPLPLAICRDFLMKDEQWVGQSKTSAIDDLSQLLYSMGSVNSVAQEYLIECVQKPASSAVAQ